MVLLEAEGSGRDVSCARQAFTELSWRLGYTSDTGAAQREYEQLKAIAAMPNPPRASTQDADGSFGACVETWFYKLDASADHLLNPKGWDGALPPRFLDRINSPEKLRGYLDGILVSDLAATGVDHRKELNEASATIVRMIVRGRPRGYSFDPGLKPVLFEFLKRWQDPETGFFGAWYRVGDRIIKMPDLSMTFHIARYLDGDIDYWPTLIDTLLSIKNDIYPNGWLDDEGMTSHNNYDVATLFQLGWPRMREGQQLRARQEIGRMLDWCLREGLAPDGTVLHGASGESLPDTYYFTAAFLDVVGYFDRTKRFWTDAEFPDAETLRQGMHARIAGLDQTDATVRDALKRLGP
jgi:hypothetical protein